MLAMAAMLLSVSCSKDDVDANRNATVSFDITTSELVTRAYGDGTKALHLMYAVYDETANSTVVEGVSKLVPGLEPEFTGLNAKKVELSLLSGNEYSILFWATSADYNDAYNINWDSKTITMESDIPGNTEAFDSFFHYEPKFKVNGSISKPITLVRPFAQLNIGTNDKTQAAAANLDVTETKVVVKSVPNILDVTNGSVSGDTNITYSYGNVPTEDVDNKFHVNGYSYLAMNYVLVGTDKIFSDIELSYKNSDGSKEFTNIYPSIPLQRNYRTNVYGSILTNSADYGVEIKPGFGENDDQEHIKDVGITANVDNANDFITAFNTLNDTDADNDVNTIILTGDVDLGNLNDLISNYKAVNPSANIVTRAGETPATLKIPARKELILDLRGFNITGTDTTEKNFQIIDNRGTLSIKNSDDTKISSITVNATINSGWNRYSAAIANNPGGNLTVGNNVLIEHLGGTDMAYGIDNLTNGKGTSAVTTIDGATIKSTYAAVRQFLNGTEATNELYVKAGSKLESPKRAIFFQSPNTNANSGKLVVAEGAEIDGEVRLSATAGTTEWDVEVSIADSALINGSQVTGANIPSGFEVKNVNGTWTIAAIVVAKIGDTDYYSLQDAIDDVQAGETIIIQSDHIFYQGANGSQNGISYTRDINFTLDLNGKTIKSDLGNIALRFKIGEGNDITNSEVTVTIKNGKVVSGNNNWCAISAATADNTGNKLILNLEDLNVENSKAGDYAIKSWTGVKINANNVNVTSSYGGGFYAVGGEIVLDNCTATQTGLHTAPYMSMAVAVSTKGKATINSGTYTTVPAAAEDAYNQGTSHGSWAAGVMNSGGELIINGGTFANGNFGDDALATYARGLIFGDTASMIQINGGTFNALKSIIDYQNNLGVQPNPNIVISGGNYSADPAVVTSYGGVEFAEGHIAVEENGRWIVKEVASATTEEQLKNLINGTDAIVYLGANITLNETVLIPQGRTLTINLNGKTLSHANETSGYAINNYGTLTITGNGTVNARGIYNGYGNGGENVATAKITIENGTFNPKGTDGGAAIFNYGIAEIKGGTFTTSGAYSLNNQAGSSMTIDNATVKGGIYNEGTSLIIYSGDIQTTRAGYSHAIYHNGGVLEVNGGTFMGNGNEVINANSSVATINAGTFTKDPNGKTSYLLAGSNMTILGGTFNAHTSNPAGHPVRPDVIVKGGTFNYEHTNIADGYKIVYNGNDTWTVVAE